MTTETTARKSDKPAAGQEGSGYFTVTVSYGPNSKEFEVPTGSTVGSVLDTLYIQELIGHKGDKNENIVVNGESAARDRVILPNDKVEVIRAAGEKG